MYKNLLDAGLIEQLIRTKEYMAAEIKLTYTLDDRRISESNDCFWEPETSRLLHTSKVNNRMIADSISRELGNSYFSEDLKNWIEAKLGYSKSDYLAVLNEENWQVPEELMQLMSEHITPSEKSDADESSTEDTAGYEDEEETCFSDDKADETNGEDDDRTSGSLDSSSQDGAQECQKNRESHTGGSSGQSSGKGANNKTNSSERSGFEEDSEAEDSEEETETKQSFAEELFSGFNTKDQPIQDDEWSEDGGYSDNSQGRYDKEYDRASDKHANSRAQAERYREVRRRILDGPDPVIREYLYRWYLGKCQICGTTFYQKNGRPFFISHFLVPRKVSDSADMIGNSVCLCANHFAQMVYGRLKSPEIIEQLERIEPTSEYFQLNLTINGEELSIKYNQKHAIALKTFYESIKESSDSFV